MLNLSDNASGLDDFIRNVDREVAAFNGEGHPYRLSLSRGVSFFSGSDVARRVCRAVRNADIPHVKNPNGGRLTLSVGVVNIPITDRTDTILEIANYADKAVYHAKRSGKNAIYEIVHDTSSAKNPGNSFVKIEF